jgi:hypothetical protein
MIHQLRKNTFTPGQNNDHRSNVKISFKFQLPIIVCGTYCILITGLTTYNCTLTVQFPVRITIMLARSCLKNTLSLFSVPEAY